MTLTDALFLILLAAVPFLLFTAIARWRRQRAAAALAQSENVLARWRVDADLWKSWRAYESELRAGGDGRRNELHDHALPENGFDVVVGRSAISIAGHVHLMPTRGTPEILNAALNDARVRPSFLELSLKYPGGATGASGTLHSASYTVMRIPVAMGAVNDARRAAAHYNGDTPGTPDFFHGPGDGTDEEDLAVCWKCGYRTYKLSSECAQCGSSMQSRRWSRRFGWTIVVLTFLLTVGMLVIMYLTVPSMLHPGEEVHGMTFRGSRTNAAVSLALLLAVLAFSAGMFLYGVWQIRTGKRHRRAVHGMIGLVSVAAVVGLAMAFLAGV